MVCKWNPAPGGRWRTGSVTATFYPIMHGVWLQSVIQKTEAKYDSSWNIQYSTTPSIIEFPTSKLVFDSPSTTPGLAVNSVLLSWIPHCKQTHLAATWSNVKHRGACVYTQEWASHTAVKNNSKNRGKQRAPLYPRLDSILLAGNTTMDP